MPDDSKLFEGLTDEQRKVAQAAAGATGTGPKRTNPSSSKRPTGTPKREAPKPSGEPSVPRREPLSTKWKALHGRVAALYASAGMIVLMADDVTGQIFIQNADDRAHEWIELAKQDSNVERVLTTITQGGAWGAVIMGNATIVLAIMARFNVLGPANGPIVAFTGVPVHEAFQNKESATSPRVPVTPNGAEPHASEQGNPLI